MFSLQSRHYIVALIFLFICRNVDLFRGSKGTKNIDLSEFHAKPSPSWSFGRLAKCTWVFHVPSERRDSGWPCLAGGGSGLMPTAGQADACTRGKTWLVEEEKREASCVGL